MMEDSIWVSWREGQRRERDGESGTEGYSLGFYLSHRTFVLCGAEQTDIGILSHCGERAGIHSRVTRGGREQKSQTGQLTFTLNYRMNTSAQEDLKGKLEKRSKQHKDRNTLQSHTLNITIKYTIFQNFGVKKWILLFSTNNTLNWSGATIKRHL